MNWKKIAKDPEKLAASLELMFEGDPDTEVGKAATAAAGCLRGLSAILKEFVRDVNQTGGVQLNDEGLHAPVADEDWIDLGETHVKACDILGAKAKVTPFSNARGD